MSGVVPKFGPGPVTYEVVEVVKGGQLIEARAAGKVGVAAAGSLKVVGVANKDAQPAASAVTTDTFGNTVVSAIEITPYTGGLQQCHVPVTYSANASFGDALVATANGTVAPAGVTPDARTVVGWCSEPNGVVIATKAVGLMKITK